MYAHVSVTAGKDEQAVELAGVCRLVQVGADEGECKTAW